MKGSELKTMIAQLVREEVRKQLPGALDRVLAERYVRETRLANTSVIKEQKRNTTTATPKKKSLAETLGMNVIAATDTRAAKPRDVIVEHEDIENEQPRAARVPEHLKKGPYADLFSDVQPLGKAGDVPQGSDVNLKALGGDFSRMRQILEKMEVRSPTVSSAPVQPARREPTRSVAPRPMLENAFDDGSNPFPDGPVGQLS